MMATFTDFEAYAEAIQDADLDVRLLYPHDRCWSIQQRELGTLRTLLTAFREQLGITPQGFLVAHRLHLARKMLMKSAPDRTTVAAVAVKFGFFDLGRFAGRYLMMFGEHPSATLSLRM